MTAILEIDGISVTFGGHRAVDQLSFAVETGKITSLIGPNGAGKTSAFNLVSGILVPGTGDVRFKGQSLVGLKPFQIAARGVGRTFQDPRVFADMSVIDNVMVGLRQSGENPLRAVFRRGSLLSESRLVRRRAEGALDEVGLLPRAADRAGDLSFGEQRFVSVARTIVSNPPLVMMDEPTVGLDQTGLAKLVALMTRLVADQGTTLLVIEHNMDVVMSISSCIVLMVEGRCVASGAPDEIRGHRNMTEAYLGRRHLAESH